MHSRFLSDALPIGPNMGKVGPKLVFPHQSNTHDTVVK